MKVFGQPWCIMGRINETEIPSLISNLNFLAVCEKTQSKYKEHTPTVVALPVFLHQYSLTHSLTWGLKAQDWPGGLSLQEVTQPHASWMEMSSDWHIFLIWKRLHVKKTKKNNEKPDKKAWDEMFSTRLLLLRCFQSGPSRFSGAHWESLLQDLQPLPPWVEASV